MNDKKLTLSTHTSLDDHDVIQEVVSGNVNAYEAVMRRYNPRLFRIARSIVLDDDRAMDIVQEAHIKAYQKLTQFNTHGNGSFAAWLFIITKNEALMLLRTLKRETIALDENNPFHLLEDGAMNDLKNDQNTPDSMMENKQLREELNQHIDKLPENFRTVFILRGIEQLTVGETAKILDLNKITVKTRYFRAKAMLKKQVLDCSRHIYEFGGHRCDAVVANVLAYIHKQ